jgi:vacuolar-type H+-ATPase subunit H
MTTAQTAPDQHPGTAGAAADEGKHVAGVAAEEAGSVVADARDQARQLLDETMQQVNEHGSEQRDRLVELLRSLSSDLHQMAESSQSSGVAHSLVRQGAERADELSSRLDGHELTDLVAEVRSFARRRPGAFLLGALAAGVVSGRFARGAKAAQGQDDETTDAQPQAHTEPLYDSPSDTTLDGSALASAEATGSRP